MEFFNLTKYSDEASTLIIVSLIVIFKVKSWIKDSHYFSSRDIEFHNVMQNILSECRNEYNADRVTILQVHNGAHYVSGKSIQKVSLTHSVTRRGILIDEGFFQDIQINVFVNEMKECIQNGYSFSDIEEMPDSFLKKHMDHTGSHTLVFLPIFGKNKDEILGFLGISWLTHNPISVETIYSMQRFCDLISSELMFKK